MNGHPRRPLDTRICGGEFPTFQLCFYNLKPTNYSLQSRLMTKNVSQKKMVPIFVGGDPPRPGHVSNDSNHQNIASRGYL